MSQAKQRQPIEEDVAVKSPDKKKIYVTIGHPKGKPKGIVVFVHGLASTALWPTMLLGSWYFRRKGYAYCRINLYDWRPGARSLMTSDLRQHTRDVDTVIRYLKKQGFSRVFAIGHSFGGLTLLRADTAELKALSLWDISSFISYPPKKWFRKDKATGATYMIGSFELFLSKRYQQGIATFPNELTLISKITTPCQICYAAGKEAMLVESSKRYFENLRGSKELVAIPNASHSFTEEGVPEKLFSKTEKWFKQHNS
jgi:alpha-beta hydrolase superfamily lysophospholipase